MSSYRFCRTDDIELLADALNRCWLPYFPDDPPITPASFKAWIRDLQVWCSSCMVAFAGPDPIGVLIGAKRTSETLVHRLAVHPDHRRQGHGRHLLTSLGSKLAILGPPRIVAEIPEPLAAALALFNACGYAEEGTLIDYVRHAEASVPREDVGTRGTFVIPVTVDDLAANGLLEGEQPFVCWKRSFQTVTARKDALQGVAVASEERIEAYLLYIKDESAIEVASFRCFFDDHGARLSKLLHSVHAQGGQRVSFPQVHPSEVPGDLLESMGFRAAGRYMRVAARAQAG